jgi:hypothetical protein
MTKKFLKTLLCIFYILLFYNISFLSAESNTISLYNLFTKNKYSDSERMIFINLILNHESVFNLNSIGMEREFVKDGLITYKIRVGNNKSIKKINLKIYQENNLITSKENLEVNKSDSAFFIKLPGFIGNYKFIFKHNNKTKHFKLNATAIECKNGLFFLNGEIFIIKGMNQNFISPEFVNSEALLMKKIGVNTIRTPKEGWREKLGETASIMVMPLVGGSYGGNWIKKTRSYQDFLRISKTKNIGFEKLVENFSSDPYLLLLLLGNESISEPFPLTEKLNIKNGTPWKRIQDWQRMLWKKAKKVDKTILTSYSNNISDYLPPEELEVYSFNSYMYPERYLSRLPFSEFVKSKGFPKKPYIHTEFGSFAVVPQAYKLGPNHPILEKIHSWNIKNRWLELIRIGTSGGCVYCWKDKANEENNMEDYGFTNNGILTAKAEKKLGYYTVSEIYRDISIKKIQIKGRYYIEIENLRPYNLNDIQLNIFSKGAESSYFFQQIKPYSKVHLEYTTKVFDNKTKYSFKYTTHQGLLNINEGYLNKEWENQLKLKELEMRPHGKLLGDLLTSEVCDINGRCNFTNISDLEVNDVCVPCFRLRTGEIIFTAFGRKSERTISVKLKYKGKPYLIDTDGNIISEYKKKYILTENGVEIYDLNAPYLPYNVKKRSKKLMDFQLIKLEPNF